MSRYNKSNQGSKAQTKWLWFWMSLCIHFTEKQWKILVYVKLFESIFHVGKQLGVDPGFQSRKRLYNRKCLFVCLSVRLKSKPLSLSESSLSAIMPIYWSLRYLSAIMPISYHANQPPCPPPSAIMPISDYSYSYQPPSCLLAIISIGYLPCFRDF